MIHVFVIIIVIHQSHYDYYKPLIPFCPSPQQLADLRKLLQDWESIITRLDNMLPRESRLAHKEEIYASWHDTFYPEGITPSLEDGGGWEIGFVRTDDLKDHFYFIWNRNTVQDLTLGVGA